MTREVAVTAEDATDKMVLSQEWVTGSAQGVSFTLTSGAGLGNGDLILTVDRGPVQLARESIDVRKLTAAWVHEIISTEPKRTLQVFCSLGQHSWNLKVPRSVLEAYSRPDSPHIQVLWPEGTPDEREGLMTDTCSECWGKFMGDDDE